MTTTVLSHYTMKYSLATFARFLPLALLTLLPSVLAIDNLLPSHALPEMLVAPPNMTIMTPRNKSPLLKQQLFDFGSPQNGVSELKRVLERQLICPSGYVNCFNDPSSCCPFGGDCCGFGLCCGSGQSCYVGGCCRAAYEACDYLVITFIALYLQG